MVPREVISGHEGSDATTATVTHHNYAFHLQSSLEDSEATEVENISHEVTPSPKHWSSQSIQAHGRNLISEEGAHCNKYQYL